MFKQGVLMVLLSLGAILFKSELAHILDGFVSIHNSVAQFLHVIFADDKVGQLIQDLISLLLIPSVLGLVVALGFWLIKRSLMPNIMMVIWVMWLVLSVTMVAQSGETTVTPETAASSAQNKTQPTATTVEAPYDDEMTVVN